MTPRNCKHCHNILTGEDEICENCKNGNFNNIDDMTKLTGAIETLALLKNLKESRK